MTDASVVNYSNTSSVHEKMAEVECYSECDGRGTEQYNGEGLSA